MSRLLLNQLAATNMAYNRFSFDYFLESMQRLGVRNVEIYGCSTHLHPYDGGDPIPKVRTKIREAGLRVISMMPEQNVYPVNLAAKEKAVRDHTAEVYKWFIYAAAELGARQMLLCPGRPYRNEPWSEGYKYSRDSIERLLPAAKDADVILNYETLRIGESTLTSNCEDTCRMVRDVNDPYLACCVDTVPVYCAHEKTEDYFRELVSMTALLTATSSGETGGRSWTSIWMLSGNMATPGLLPWRWQLLNTKRTRSRFTRKTSRS